MRILYLPNSHAQQRQFEKESYNCYPVRLAMECEWHRKQKHEVDWDINKANVNFRNWNWIYLDGAKVYDRVIQQPEGLPFLSLPHPDRVFTRAKEFTSGNYKYLPGTHMQCANGCWWGKCSFCVENRGSTSEGTQKDCLMGNSPLSYQVRPVEDCIEEIKECVALGFKEVFDDSGTFPTGRWLDDFCRLLKGTGVHFGCNMRIIDLDYRRLHNAGFRMLLFGIESANQVTLDKIQKGINADDIIPTIKKASKAGLEPHIAVMFGYPWESDDDAIRTLKLVHFLLKKGFAKTAQASFYTTNTPSNENHRKYIQKIYEVAYSPSFWFTQIKDIKDIDDLKYLWRKIKVGLEGYILYKKGDKNEQ